MSKKPELVSAELDIKDKLDGEIEAVIRRLQELAEKYPGATIDVHTDYEYGESYAAASLRFMRPKTALETERDEWDAKARQYDALRREAAAFVSNGVSYPREDEINALKKELGFFAMAPMRGTLMIHDGEVLVMDMTRGARRRDGSWVLQMMGFGGDGKLQELWDKMDAEYRT